MPYLVNIFGEYIHLQVNMDTYLVLWYNNPLYRPSDQENQQAQITENRVRGPPAPAPCNYCMMRDTRSINFGKVCLFL